jgi:predicted ATP-grasp superfamily ATP-dependent carboligase
MRVLVTDGNNRAALAVTRALGRRGHQVFVAEQASPALAQTSRYCAGAVTYPDPGRDERGFIDALLGAVRRERIDVLLPIADVASMTVSASRAEFLSSCRVPLPDDGVLRRAADKVDVLRTAERLGVPIPRSVFLDRADDFDPRTMTLPYPVVLKPHRSRVRTPEGWQSCAVSYALDEEDLRRRLAAMPKEHFPVLLQERVVGPGLGFFALYDRGRCLTRFSHRRLREKPPSGGVSVLCESIPAPPETADAAERLLRELGWQGVAMVEFKIDARDGTPRLMEINGRFWGSLQLAVDAGVDFPNLLIDSLDGRATPPADYRVGVKSRWLWGDVDSLLTTLVGRHRDELPGVSGRLAALGRFVRLWEPGLVYENPRLGDIRPFFFETAQWLRDNLGRRATPPVAHAIELTGPKEHHG